VKAYGKTARGGSKKNQYLALTFVGAALLFFSSGSHDSEAAFTLNFIPDESNYTNSNDNPNFSCNNVPGVADFNCGSGGRGDFDLGGSHDDGTAMFQRVFTNGGKTYYNVVIGDYTQDSFYMEYIIEANAGWGTYDNRGDTPASASAYTAGSIGNCSTTTCAFGEISPYSPDTSHNGNGSGNPNRVIMRMVVNDGITHNEFLKDQFDKKPLITQNMLDPNPTNGISMEYSIDMRSKTYSDPTPIASADRINRTFLIGDTAANQGDYDSTGAVPTPISMIQTNDDITAGAYTYTTGSSFGGSDGTYTYYLADGVTVDPSGFQPTNVDYSVFCMTGQNVDWSGNGACTNGNGGGGGRGGGGWGGW
jgi:hypothetical protein